ncbi:hypothetical protein ON010_g1245 [Phytophthora cinnamomi]|nr:hypothetical protein ON010_g1245 [Phytophthora cinnamomi]
MGAVTADQPPDPSAKMIPSLNKSRSNWPSLGGNALARKDRSHRCNKESKKSTKTSQRNSVNASGTSPGSASKAPRALHTEIDSAGPNPTTAEDSCPGRRKAVGRYLRGGMASLSLTQATNASKLADRFVLDEEDVLHYVGKGRKLDETGATEAQLRLVVPTTMIAEVLHSCHDSIEGGHQGIARTFHRVKNDYYWIGLYAAVTCYVRACADCSTRKATAPKGLLAGQCARRPPVSGVVNAFCATIAEDSASTNSQDVASVFEECVFCQFDARSMIRYDRDPRFISETFTAFLELIQWRSRATLSYRPQANGQQERSVKSVIQAVNGYVEDPLQQNWDEIAEKWSVPLGERSEPATTVPTGEPSVVIYGTSETRPGKKARSPMAWTFPHQAQEDDRRPTAERIEGLDKDERFDFDEELLPEGSWEPGAADDKYIVEAILDDQWPLSTGTERTKREFHVKWRGHDEPTWEPVSDLSCGGLLFDYLLRRKRGNHFQMVQVADES